MNASETVNWHEANQRYLMAALTVVRSSLETHVESLEPPINQEKAHRFPLPRIWERSTSSSNESAKRDCDAEEALKEALSAMPAPPALETVSKMFSLSPFERDLLLLCAGIELDSSIPSLCASIQGDSRRAYPTFSLAMASLPGAHWSALTPIAPLRKWRLIEIWSGDTLTLSPLRIDERILHYLTGLQYMDERLAGIVEPITAEGDQVQSHMDLAQKLAAIWSQAEGNSALPAIQLCGNEFADKRAIASLASNMLGLNLRLISANSLTPAPNDLEALARLWEREAALSGNVLILDCEDIDKDASRDRAITKFIDGIRCPLIIASRERRDAQQRPTVTFEVDKPTASEQCITWQGLIENSGNGSSDGLVDALVSQFNFSAQTIHNISSEALRASAAGDTGTASLSDYPFEQLWDICRSQSRPRLENLAQRIEPAATWEDLVLPELQREILREIAIHVRQRARVYNNWGFASKSKRGLGISALFIGPSGTGKTLAAEVLANELRLDLYRIDLSQVISKYIGETEKNLRRVFDAADECGAILAFDEADALFGKRSEVKDSHDRYANIEISYLLQRMESYRGLAILTSNMKNALDPAFLRRIRFVVQFPFPDLAQRAEIWKHIFPEETPTDGLDTNKLARLNVAGGNIRNIALNAAFLAAENGKSVRMGHLLRATKAEYAKMEKPLTEAEIGGWV